MTLPSWYKIREIDFIHFKKLLQPIYNILKKKNTHIHSKDPFLQNIWSQYYNTNFLSDYQNTQSIRSLSMVLGHLHENIIACFPNWEKIYRHKTKCDIIGYNGRIVVEIKNNVNTMNSDSKRSVLMKLHSHIIEKNGNKAFLVIINNCKKPKQILDNGIVIYSGETFYHIISNRVDFFNDLLYTLTYIFSNYKTFNQLMTET